MKQRFVKSFVSFAMIINLLISPLQLDLQLINYDDVEFDAPGLAPGLAIYNKL